MASYTLDRDFRDDLLDLMVKHDYLSEKNRERLQSASISIDESGGDNIRLSIRSMVRQNE